MIYYLGNVSGHDSHAIIGISWVRRRRGELGSAKRSRRASRGFTRVIIFSHFDQAAIHENTSRVV